jgi:hypothetical protein
VSSCPFKFDWREALTSSVQEHEQKLARVVYHLYGRCIQKISLYARKVVGILILSAIVFSFYE